MAARQFADAIDVLRLQQKLLVGPELRGVACVADEITVVNQRLDELSRRMQAELLDCVLGAARAAADCGPAASYQSFFAQPPTLTIRPWSATACRRSRALCASDASRLCGKRCASATWRRSRRPFAWQCEAASLALLMEQVSPTARMRTHTHTAQSILTFLLAVAATTVPETKSPVPGRPPPPPLPSTSSVPPSARGADEGDDDDVTFLRNVKTNEFLATMDAGACCAPHPMCKLTGVRSV